MIRHTQLGFLQSADPGACATAKGADVTAIGEAVEKKPREHSGEEPCVAAPQVGMSPDVGTPSGRPRTLKEIMEHGAACADRLRGEMSLLKAATENMAAGLCMFGPDARLLVANSRYAELYGLGERDVLPGTTLMDILRRRIEAGAVPGKTASEYIRLVQASIATGKPSTTFTELVGGRTIAVHFRPMGEGGWVASHEDVTERIELEAKLLRLAETDGLTDLVNGAKLRTQLQHMLDTSADGAVALLQIDFDRFKEVNDQVGHDAADAILKEAANRLRSVVRGSDIVGRLGGDEFAVICLNANHAEIAAAAARILRSLSAPFVAEEELFIGASIGIAVAAANTSQATELMKHAGLALRRAKADGSGTYRFFEPSMHLRAQNRRQLALDLHKALPRGEFEIAYQPMFNVATGTITGFEALLRWHHPVRGFVSPDDFIPVAEDTGLIHSIGEWTLRQACAECATWPAPLKVSVNFSATQFTNRCLAASVSDALAAAALPAGRLEIEITETALLLGDQDTVALLKELKSLGVAISMDDFGTGYSALSYLARFPFEKIKIDRCFLQARNGSGRRAQMLEAIASMAATLGIATTVEGVETQEQFARIRALGCTEVQGFLFGKPMSAEDARELAAGESETAVTAA